ncbi:hypothetical protein PR048_010180 [Dryococelus australis]|uniref:Palmitoyltransferase n=1 Tax=Dryococelus australis TaxID=614101 RepID=A0ABQ9I204_9NEOP|nr:hypothetical protein PR048_010180 [Dryococelus australis]
MNTFQDRLRIPWRGGAKQISLDSAIPLVLQPLLAYIAAQNVWCTILVFVSTYACLCYIYHLFQMFHPRSKFFFMWALTSVVLLLLVFEVNVVPLLEILPTENVVFVLLVVAALGCSYKVRTRASLSHVVHGDIGDELSGRAVETVCSVCRHRVPPRTYHCSICQACVVARDRHCVWWVFRLLPLRKLSVFYNGHFISI